MKEDLSVDRTMFKAWTFGLRKYSKDDVVHIVDFMLCSEIDMHLRKGNTITLTLDNKPFSRVSLVGKLFIEAMLDKGEFNS